MLLVKDKFLTISNAISILRLLLTLPIAWLLHTSNNTAAFWLCVVGAVSDWADGAIARWTNTETEWGRLLDPIADKVLVGVVVLMLLATNLLPLWFVAVVLGRDAVILLGGVVAARRTQQLPASMWSGKVAVTLISCAGFLALLRLPDIRDVAMAAAVVAMGISLWDYGKRLYGIIRQTQENA